MLCRALPYFFLQPDEESGASKQVFRTDVVDTKHRHQARAHSASLSVWSRLPIPQKLQTSAGVARHSASQVSYGNIRSRMLLARTRNASKHAEIERVVLERKDTSQQGARRAREKASARHGVERNNGMGMLTHGGAPASDAGRNRIDAQQNVSRTIQAGTATLRCRHATKRRGRRARTALRHTMRLISAWYLINRTCVYPLFHGPREASLRHVRVLFRLQALQRGPYMHRRSVFRVYVRVWGALF